MSKKCLAEPSPSGRRSLGFALNPSGERPGRVCASSCASVCACECTQAPDLDCQGCSGCFQGLKLPENGKAESESARGDREGGREGSG